MDTKRIITNEDAKRFFSTSINSMDDGMGIALFNSKTQEITFNFNAVLLLGFQNVYAENSYHITFESITDNFRDNLLRTINEDKSKYASFDFIHFFENENLTYHVKLELQNNNNIKLYILSYKKLLKTEENMALISNFTGAGKNMFVGNSWWIDYDKYDDHFYQSDYGPDVLGIPIKENKLYNTHEFQKVRENAKKESPFFDECIRVEQANYELVRSNQTDYFGGRTPALTVDNKIVWIEAYGKCLIRYPDGQPRFFIAIDLYLSDITENFNQLTIINSLTEKGLTNSKVGVWYYQKHFTEGRYYFTNSFKQLMCCTNTHNLETVYDFVESYYRKLLDHRPDLSHYITNFKDTHDKIFTGEIEKYNVLLPNYTIVDGIIQEKWLEVRGTVIERDENGDIVLFVGVNIDITESYLREQELQRLKIQNERLQIAEIEV